jgi:hypothetical protein
MNKLLLIGLILTISCSKKPDGNKSQETMNISTQESIIFDAAKKIDQNAAEIFDLGTVRSNSIKKIFSIANTSNSSLTLNFLDLQTKVSATSRFTLNLTTATACPSVLKINKTCSFELTLNKVINESYDAISTNIIDTASRGSNQEFGSMIFSGVKADDVSSEIPLIAVMRIDRLAESFIIPATQSITKRFYIGNIGTSSLKTPGVVAPLDGIISNNSCLNLINLKPNGTCFFEVTYASNSAPDKVSYNTQITFSSIDPLVNTTGIKIDLAISNQPVVIPVSNANFNQVGTISDLSLANSKTRLYVTNSGSTSLSTSTIGIPSPYIIYVTSCPESLKVGKTCYFDLALDSSKLAHTNGIAPVISVGSTSFRIKAGSIVSTGDISCISPFVLKNGLCSSPSLNDYTPGFRLISDFLINQSTSSTECTINDFNGEAAVIKHSDNSSINNQGECQSNNLMFDFWSSWGNSYIQDGKLICDTGTYLLILKQGGQNNCDNFFQLNFSNRMISNISSGLIIGGLNIVKQVGFGNDLFFLTEQQSNNYFLGKISLSDTDSNFVTQPGFVYNGSNGYQVRDTLLEINGMLVMQEYNSGNFLSHNPISGLTSVIQLACYPNCYPFYLRKLDSGIYFESYNVADGSHDIYRSTDGVNLVPVAHSEIQSYFLEYNFFENDTSLFVQSFNPDLEIMRINKSTGAFTIDHHKAAIVVKLGNSIYGFEYIPPYRIFKSNNQNGFDIIPFGKRVNRVNVANNKLFIIAPNDINPIDLDVYTLSNADIAPIQLSEGILSANSCTNDQNISFINPLSGSLMFSCTQSGTSSYGLKGIKPNGTIFSLSNDDMRIEDNDAITESSHKQEGNFVEYKGKLYFKYIDAISSKSQLATLDANDSLIRITAMNLDGSNSVMGRSSFLLFKDSLFFSGNNDFSVTNPVDSFEIMRYFE